MRMFVWLGVGLVAVGCSKDGADKPAAPAKPEPQAARPKPKAEPPKAPAFVLGTSEGVVALDLGGKTIFQYNQTEAEAPRFVPGTRDVVFYSEEQRQIYKLSLETGEQAVLATVKEPAGCETELGLRVHADWDFVVDASAERLCYRLYDRNEAMADIGMTGRVDLRTGKVEAAVSQSMSEKCKEDDKAEELFDCKPAKKAVIEPSALMRADVDAKLMPKGFEAELRSPSGRWAVIAGNVSDGDYIHRDVLMLDTESGDVFALVEGPWPKPVARAAVEKFEYQTADAVGESTIEWIGATDVLHLDRLLITPGTATVSLDGDLAR